DEPRHPYTLGLLNSVPDPHDPRELTSIPGVAGGVGERSGGCAFAPRCTQQVAKCVETMPPLTTIAAGRQVRCVEWQHTPALTHRSRVVSTAPARDALLAVESLRAEHRGRDGTVVASADVSFTI